MSKWKDKEVKIEQIIGNSSHYTNPVVGLGDDQRLYEWDQIHGAWRKMWNETDEPNV